MTVTDYEVAVPTRGHRRPTVSSQREFVVPLVDELQSSIASLRDAAGRAEDGLDGAIRQVERMAWLVDILGAISADVRERPHVSVDLRAAVRDAAAGAGLHVSVDVPGNTRFLADPDRLRIALKLLMGAAAGAEPASARMFVPGLLVVEAPNSMLEDERRCWEVRTARRLLEAEGCQFRLRASKTGVRIDVAFWSLPAGRSGPAPQPRPSTRRRSEIRAA